MIGKTFDEFQQNQKYVFPTLTVTESHIVQFAGLSGDYNPLHVDEEYAKNTGFKGRIAHGMLTASIISGYLGMLAYGTVIALLEVSFKFLSPVKIGDTVTTTAEVIEKKSSSKYNGGIIKFKLNCKKQNNETAVEGEAVVLISN